MLKFLKGLLITFGILFLVLIGGSVFGLRYVAKQWQTEPLPDHMVLSLTLKPELRETQSAFPFAEVIGGGAPSLLELVNTLKAASEDERVQGLFLDLSAAQVRPAEAQELRAAISRFRASGRFVQAYADSLEGSGGISAYHLATGAESIALQPSGLLDIRGISLTAPFFGEALEKLGIEADFRTRHEYKGATASMTSAAFPPPIRQNYRRLVDSLYAGIAADIATARRLSPSSVNGLIDTAPLTAGEAKSNGLIDQMLYRDEAIDAARARADGAMLVPLARYRNDADFGFDGEDPARIAVIAVDGPIVRGRSSLFARDREAAAQTIVDAVKDAREDKRVKAIILRVSSPGGSYVASDTILHALSPARDRFHERHGRIGRIFRRACRRSCRRPPEYHHRLHRRRQRQAEPGRASCRVWHPDRQRERRPQCRHVQHDEAFQRRRKRPARRGAGHDLRGFHDQGRRRPPAWSGGDRRRRSRTGVERPGRKAHWSCRCAWRLCGS